MEYKHYTTVEGDRWDSIAFRAYGDPMRTVELQRENPHVPLDNPLAAGLIINIPLIAEATADSDKLPPWKQ